MASYPLSLLRMARAEQAPTGAATEQLAMALLDVSRIQPCQSHLTLHSVLETLQFIPLCLGRLTE